MSLKFKNDRLAELIGSPKGYLSPLDRIRTGKRERAAQFGIDTHNGDQSFEGNQSFPRLNLNKKFKSPDFKLNGNELNSISFLPTFKKQFKNKYDLLTTPSGGGGVTGQASHNSSINASMLQHQHGHHVFDKSWQFYNHFSLSTPSNATTKMSQDTIQFQQNFINKNPNKALLTINGRSSVILTANDIACDLFDYNEDMLIGMKLKDLLDKNSQYKHDIIIESHLDDVGELVLCSGKLFDAIDSNNIVIPISIYMQKLKTNDSNEPICLCIIEPVQRITGYFKMNVKGHIRYADDKFSNIFGYVNQQTSLIGKDVNELMPSLKLPMCGITRETKKQTLTGRTLNEITVPLTVRIITKQLFNNEEIVYNCSVNFYSNISGLLTVNVDDGTINSYNPTFTRILFGSEDNELKNKPITTLIPNFYSNSNDSLSRRMSYDDDDDEEEEDVEDHNVCDSRERSFNSKSIDSSNLSVKSLITATSSSSTASTDTNKTQKFCVKCGRELENYMKPHNSILDNIVNLETPKRKCLNFIESNDFKLQPLPQTPTSQQQQQPRTPTSRQQYPQTPTSVLRSQDQPPRTPTSALRGQAQPGTPKSVHSLNESLSYMTNNDNDDEEYLCDDCQNNDEPSDSSDVSLIAIDNVLEPNSAKKKTGYYRKRTRNHADSSIPVITLTTATPTLPTANTTMSNNGTSATTNITSTPAPNETSKTKVATTNIAVLGHDDGMYYGMAKHNDGSFINIIYQRKLIEISKNNFLICVWIMKNPDMEKSIIDASMDQSLLKRSFTTNGSTVNDSSFTQLNQYSLEYDDIGTLGRGASGFVQFAKRKQDSFEVVTKYIRKKKIHKDSWINDDRYGQVPLEISILCKLEHKNIIKVMDIFQDNDYIQMVMQKHGCGMDLFEFIDRQPRIDEKLASYIFRQIVSAIAYLHSNNIVHRDIKDENIVINESFEIRLIDFGSAAYMVPGKKFATFCGTLDYCSPEVLLGNKYYGPELDCWTMGIVLYTLVFSENPFFDADETIECMLKPPFKVSKELMKLLFSILCPKPEFRLSVKDVEVNEWVTQEVDITQYKWENVIKNTVFLGNNAGDCRPGDSESLDESISHQLCDDLSIKQSSKENQQSDNQMDCVMDKHSRSF